MSLMLLIVGLVLFVMLVVVHEWGHFILARRNGVEVEEFGIGFPPRAWGRKMKSGFVFSLNWLPLGGFVKLKGENDADTGKGTYGAANIWAKSRILMAGVGMNLLTAVFMLTILAWVGMPVLIDNQFTVKNDTKVLKNQILVGLVEENSPASQAGLMKGDQIVRVATTDATRLLCSPALLDAAPNEECKKASQEVKSASDLPVITKSFAGEEVNLYVKRDGQDKQLTTTLRSTEEVEASQKTSEPKGYLGISPAEYTLQRSTWSAPVVAVGLTVQLTKATLAGIWNALSQLVIGNAGKASQQVAGPVGIFMVFRDGSLLGYQFILMIVAVISLTLAIMNALPIPALDGGRLFVTWLFKLTNRKLTKKLEDRIHGTGFAVLMVLFVLITIVDVKRF